MRRSSCIAAVLLAAVAPTLSAQSDSAISHQPSAINKPADGRPLTADGQSVSQPDAWRRGAVHYGKWLTAAGTAALTALASREHQKSRKQWNELLTICRSAEAACTIGADGRYVRSDAEALYQRSRAFDRRANRRLLGAQISLVATAAFFILDLRKGQQGPENIPFAPVKVSVEPTRDGAIVGMRIAF